MHGELVDGRDETQMNLRSGIAKLPTYLIK